ncbi:FAD-binding domain-containing protein [Pseudovirgaria hyperparasitica]|uniref:Delta(24)-sterol reductase n=1 Tax=Pseudovirgaria hyperparasitica TaxID=470096 RepID=A0A6A6WGB3_9PEZI|nr:FAD-binding domain-containing protein [Pseudovirgaria hyperparasitica]KAF2761882.1 FAD-binding domain-containing protein [Pseudovirgaria hyperparasitica]
MAVPAASCLLPKHTRTCTQARFYTSSSTQQDARHATSLFDMHDRDVESIINGIRRFHAHGEPYRIAHGSTNSTRPRAPGTNVIDISRLNRVLHIDRDAQTAIVEPNVPMDRLVEATLDHGLIPPVVMEFPGITVGGGFAGTCGESSSFKHGFFSDNIDWADIVLANGELVRVSPEVRPDLFSGAAGALGTLGVTTRVQIRLVKAEKYVDVTVHPLTTTGKGNDGGEEDIFAAAVDKAALFARRSDIDHLDGILFSRTEGALMTGTMTSAPLSLSSSSSSSSHTNPQQLTRFSRPKDPWYYMHISHLLTQQPHNPRPTTFRTPLAEYLFRYNRGGFWVGHAAFEYFHFPFTALTRRLLDDFLHTRMMYTALHASGLSERYIVQDYALPFSGAVGFLKGVQRDVGVWPLWLCPLRTVSGTAHFHPRARRATESASTTTTEAGTAEGQKADEEQPEHILNIGIYGWPPSPTTCTPTFAAVNRHLNALAATHGGTKWLYAQSFYTAEEFWQIYDRAWYEGLRAKYGAAGGGNNSLPSVTDKVAWDGVEKEQQVRDVWPAAGIRGLRAAIKSKSYLDARKSRWKEWS